MTRNRADGLSLMGAALTLGLLALAWGHLPAGERAALLPLSVSLLVTGGLVALVGRLEDHNRAVANAGAQGLILQAAVAAAALAFGWDLLRALSVGTGLALIVSGNATARARPGEWFGFRTRWTLLSERAWYASQRRAAPALVTVGAVYTAFAALTPGPLLPWINPVGLLVLLLPVVYSLSRAAYQDYLHDPERRPAVPGARRHLPAFSFPERVMTALMLGLPLLSLTCLLIALPHLPERVPLHFDAAGRVDRYGSRTELLVLPLIGLLTAAFILACMRYATATLRQRHLALVIGAMVAAFMVPILLGFTGDKGMTLGLAHALLLMPLALACALPDPQGQRRPGAARLFLMLAALLGLLAFVPGQGRDAVAGLTLALGTPLFLAPAFVFGIPPRKAGPEGRL